MGEKQAAVKRYVVRLSVAEREQLDRLIQTGKRAAREVLKARILLKADEASEGWSDSQIAAALDTSIDTVARTRQRLVEDGLAAALTRQHSPASARQRIFKPAPAKAGGAAEAKLIALACSEPPKGRARWTLKLLEAAVVELNIVKRASDNTIGRTLKKTRSSRTGTSNGSSHPMPMPPSWPAWRMCWKSITDRMIRTARWSAWTRPQSNSSPRRGCRSRQSQAIPAGMTMSTPATGRPTCS